MKHPPLDPREASALPGHTAVLKEDVGARVERIAAGSEDVVRKTYFSRPFLIWRSFAQRSRARREFENLSNLDAAGVPCVRPLGWTDVRVLGCVPSCALLTEYLPAAPDLRYVLRNGCSIAERRELAQQFGRLVRAVHRAGYVSTTFSTRNVLVQSTTSLVVCDQPSAAGFRGDVAGRWPASVDLFDALFSSSRRRDWSRTDRFRALLAYAAGNREEARRWWRRLVRRRPGWNRLLEGLVRLRGRIRHWWSRPRKQGRR